MLERVNAGMGPGMRVRLRRKVCHGLSAWLNMRDTGSGSSIAEER
jgi:hypothetical protein